MRDVTRREFLTRTAMNAGRLALVGAAAPVLLGARRSPKAATLLAEPFGSLESIAPGVWALISTPLGGDRTTLSNGGFIAGRDAVLAVEGFNMPAGAAWLGAKARELTGRWPTHVVLTHYHSDHANGVAGYQVGDDRPVTRLTMVTRDLVLTRNTPQDPARSAALAAGVPIDPSVPTVLDLGGRTVRIVPRGGHTASDLSLEIDELNVVFCGDLVWNGMFPNYVDAEPSRLAREVAALPGDARTTYIPGHGPVARAADRTRYVAMLGEIEHAARTAHAAGRTAKEAATGYALPASLGEWTLFNAAFFERAFTAWYRELDR